MPSIIRTTTVVPAAVSPKKEVGFAKDPVVSLSRPVSSKESWPAYHFEMHARKCAYCHDPYEVHRNHQQLCDVGHRLAQTVAHFIYNKADGETYSTTEERHKPVRVEIPTGYVQVAGLLKAIERSLRRRSRDPIVSQDRTYYVAPRTSASPSRSLSVKAEEEPKPKSTRARPRSGEIVDWPEAKTKPKRVLAEINNTPSCKRGSLYEEDLAKQRLNAKQYTVEVREPTLRDWREHRLSGYYR